MGSRCQGRSVVSLVDSWWSIGGSSPSYAAGLRLVRCLVPVTLAWCAQQGTTEDRQRCGDKAEVKSLTYLILHPTGKHGVVEICNYIISGPRNRYQANETSQDEKDPPRDSDGGFGRSPLGTLRALHTDDSNHTCQHGKDAGNYHHGTGNLEVTGQCQLGAVDLALVDAGAVPNALHPKAFHIGHSCYNIGAYMCRSPPVWQNSSN